MRASLGRAAPLATSAAVFAGVFVVALGVYAATCARTVTLVDSGELILAAALPGVAHPPGFPLYVLVGHLFSLLPLGSVAFRLSLMSAVFGAAVAALVAAAANELLAWRDEAERSAPRGKRRKARKASEEERGLAPAWRLAAATAAGLAFAFSRTPWAYATVAEVYSLHLALLAGVVVCLLAWRRRSNAGEDGSGESGAIGSRPAARPLALAGLLFGLALGVHHATAILALPAFAVFVWRTLPGRKGPGKRPLRRLLAPPALAAAAGLLVYLYLPLAAASEPLLNWGDPSSPERFWRHVTAWQYQTYLASVDAQTLAENAGYFLDLLWRELTPAGLALALWGLGCLFRRDRALFWLLALIAATGVAYAVYYDIAEDSDAYFLTTFLALALALAAGLGELARRASAARRPAAGLAAGLALAALPAALAALHFGERDRSWVLVAPHYVADALATVAPGGLLMTLDWQLYAPFLYLHHLEGLREDATVVDVNLVRRSWYVEGYLERAYPEMMAACRRESEAFLRQLHRFEAGEPYDAEEIQRRFLALLEAMIAHFLPAREAHLALPLEPGLATGYRWVPRGLTFELRPSDLPGGDLHGGEPAPLEPAPELHLGPLLDPEAPLSEVARLKVRPTYAQMIANRGRYLELLGRGAEAQEHYDLARRLEPGLELSPRAPGAR